LGIENSAGMQLGPLEKIISYVFKEKDLLKEALTHRSYLNERADWGLPNNERLEFLGDAVLELATTEELFKRYPHYTEGQLTPIRSALVNYVMMARIARELGLEKYILLSRGESKDVGRAREVILANALEAIIGAIYLDGGYAPARKFVLSAIMSELDDVMKKGLYKDAKSLLQEKIQESKKVTPTYKVLRENGPDHAKVFTVGVFYGDTYVAEGSGQSKQDAEVEAAKAALALL
jgi:ribonuclease III